jgi:hypothetical protein
MVGSSVHLLYGCDEMTDIVDRLLRPEPWTDDVLTMQDAAEEIKLLRKQLEVASYWGPRWEKEHAENELLRQQLADIKREWSIADSHKEDYAEKLEQQLAQCQARENVLRDALKESYDEDGLCVEPDDFVKQSDSTALDTLLAAAELKGRREALLEAAEVEIGQQPEFEKYESNPAIWKAYLLRMAKELE